MEIEEEDDLFSDDDEFSDDEIDDRDESSEEEEDDDDDDELLPIERRSRKMEKEEKRKASIARLEQLQVDVKDEPETYQLPPDDDKDEEDFEVDEEEAGRKKSKETKDIPDLTLVQQRIQDIIRVLADFKNRRAPDRSRNDYLERLTSDLATYYGYNHFLIRYFIDTFSVPETMELFEANETQAQC